MKQKSSYSSMAFPCCQSCPPVHEVRETQWILMELTYLLVVYHIKSYNMCRQHYKTGLTLRHSNNAQSKEAYTTQVSISTVPMQQVCPERTQNASDKQQTMQANLVNGLHIKSTGSHEVLHLDPLLRMT